MTQLTDDEINAAMEEQMTPHLQRDIQAAQLVTTAMVGEQSYPRIRHAGTQRCGDCWCAPDQLHTPGCDQEVCPRCHTEQALGCGCWALH